MRRHSGLPTRRSPSSMPFMSGWPAPRLPFMKRPARLLLTGPDGGGSVVIADAIAPLRRLTSDGGWRNHSIDLRGRVAVSLSGESLGTIVDVLFENILTQDGGSAPAIGRRPQQRHHPVCTGELRWPAWASVNRALPCRRYSPIPMAGRSRSIPPARNCAIRPAVRQPGAIEPAGRGHDLLLLRCAVLLVTSTRNKWPNSH